MTQKIELVRVAGTTPTRIDAEITEDGELLFVCQDGTEHEYWLRIPAAEKDRLLLALLAKHHGGNHQLVSELRAFLAAEEIASDFFSH